MSKHRHISLTTEERTQLEALIHKGSSPARVQTRARILLLCDRSQGEEQTMTAIAKSVMCSLGTVSNVKGRYFSGGVEAALTEKPRPGAEPTFTGETEAQLTMLACSAPPQGYGRWTLRLLADRMVELGYVESISHVSVRTILKKTNCSLGG